MFRRVLIVAETEGFIVKGIETKLKNIGIESVYSSPRMKDLEGKLNETDLVMLYTDDNAAEYATSLVYIKDRCSELDEQVIVIGAKIEFDTVKGFIPESQIFRSTHLPCLKRVLIRMKRDSWSDRMPNQMPSRPMWKTYTSSSVTAVRMKDTLISAAYRA